MDHISPCEGGQGCHVAVKDKAILATRQTLTCIGCGVTGTGHTDDRVQDHPERITCPSCRNTIVWAALTGEAVPGPHGGRAQLVWEKVD